jgi:2-succinyl-6-hydroxy-2,4-cyclohexadiene-1-carboxylate synthase
MRETLVLLHGFTQTGRSWDAVLAALEPGRYRALAPDLRGHGTAARERPVSFDAVAADVLAAVDGEFALAGYSQGGRLALHVALTTPQRIRRLVLLSTTAGLEDPGERAARRAADEALADRMAASTIEALAGDWARQPVLAGQSEQVRRAAHADRLRNDPAGLAAALRGIGTGTMTPLWERLGALTMPVAVLAGERDAKFVALGRRLADGLPAATLTVVPGAGHSLPLEAPEAVAAAIDAQNPIGSGTTGRRAAP